MLIIKKILNRIRLKFAPTELDNEYKRWISNGGDDSHRYTYKLSENSLVMDLGGYKGQFASDIYSMYNCNVLIFEPVIFFAEKIKQRFINNSKIKTYTFALGKSNREETIALIEDGTSLYRKSSQYEKIRFEDISAFIKKMKSKKLIC